jgi:hypothetical protein
MTEKGGLTGYRGGLAASRPFCSTHKQIEQRGQAIVTQIMFQKI